MQLKVFNYKYLNKENIYLEAYAANIFTTECADPCANHFQKW